MAQKSRKNTTNENDMALRQVRKILLLLFVAAICLGGFCAVVVWIACELGKLTRS